MLQPPQAVRACGFLPVQPYLRARMRSLCRRTQARFQGGPHGMILPPGIALGYLLARVRFRGRSVIETLASLPLVLPPTAVGYVLLRALGRHGPFGEATLGERPDVCEPRLIENILRDDF